MNTVTLETGCGQITGERREGAWLFHGIPYATAERFAPPEPVERWDGPLDAAAEDVDCPQYSMLRDESKEPDNFYYWEFRSERKAHYAESPLTLNIITPPEARDCPVLLFIHGGGYETGTAGDLPYGTTAEYAARGIVLVSINYRLNVFSLYECGNFGLLDQLAAVKWVRAHIAAFGGDPDRITLMGQSAGAMSITNLLYSDALKGDIVGAVMMSGGGPLPKFAGPWTKAEAAAFWQAVRTRAGADSEEDFKALPAEVVWEAWYAESRAKGDARKLLPGIDGVVIPDAPQTIVSRNRDLDVPILLGVTSQDMFPPLLHHMALHWGLRNEREGRSPVYCYFFDRTPPGNKYKAFHAADLWYLFGNLDKSWRPFEEVDYRLSAGMIDAVAAFIKTGSPNGPGLPQWAPISRRQKGFRLFNGCSDGTIGPAACRRKTVHSMLFDRGPL